MFKTKKIKFDLKKRNFHWDVESQDYVYFVLNESEVHCSARKPDDRNREHLSLFSGAAIPG